MVDDSSSRSCSRQGTVMKRCVRAKKCTSETPEGVSVQRTAPMCNGEFLVPVTVFLSAAQPIRSIMVVSNVIKW